MPNELKARLLQGLDGAVHRQQSSHEFAIKLAFRVPTKISPAQQQRFLLWVVVSRAFGRSTKYKSTRGPRAEFHDNHA
jgi:hypothetical protein